MANILVVDDEMGIRALLSEILTDEGHTVEVAENAANARLASGESQGRSGPLRPHDLALHCTISTGGHGTRCRIT